MTSPSETLNCLPPVSIIAYITLEDYQRAQAAVKRSGRAGGEEAGACLVNSGKTPSLTLTLRQPVTWGA
jgi:hypothetical protein